jgi:hypothetical protein
MNARVSCESPSRGDACDGCGNTAGELGQIDGKALCGECAKKSVSEFYNGIELLTKDPDFFAKATAECGKKVVGEEGAIHTILLCASGRLVENCQLASYNLFVNSESGAGKDYVTSRVLGLLPEDRLVKRTRISPAVFTYWHNPSTEPDWTWDGKVCYLEDISGNVMNHEVFKTMSSSGSSATILVNQVPVDIEVRGKPVLIITAAMATPAKELLRRFTILHLDETVGQTGAIKRMQAKAAATGMTLEYDDTMLKAIKSLKRVKVKIPYAEMLADGFPDGHIILRTHFPRFLDYVKASTAFHQHQREKDGEGYLLATAQDYEIARVAMGKTTSNKNMIPLTTRDQRLVGIIRERQAGGLGWLSVTDIASEVTFFGERTLYRHLDKLAEYGILEKDKREEEFAKPVMVYRAVEAGSFQLPTWDELAGAGDAVDSVVMFEHVEASDNNLHAGS